MPDWAGRKRPHQVSRLPGAPEQHPQPCPTQQPSCSRRPHHPGAYVVNAHAGVVQKAVALAVAPAVPAMADDGHAGILQGAVMLTHGVLPIFHDPPQLSHKRGMRGRIGKRRRNKTTSTIMTMTTRVPIPIYMEVSSLDTAGGAGVFKPATHPSPRQPAEPRGTDQRNPHWACPPHAGPHLCRRRDQQASPSPAPAPGGASGRIRPGLGAQVMVQPLTSAAVRTLALPRSGSGDVQAFVGPAGDAGDDLEVLVDGQLAGAPSTKQPDPRSRYPTSDLDCQGTVSGTIREPVGQPARGRRR